MENQIEAIRASLLNDADPAARRAGVVACRELLTILETTTAGEQPAPTTPPTPPAPATTPASPPLPIDPATLASLVGSLGSLPPEQLLDLAIARLRAALPPSASVPAPQPLRFHIVPLHHLERSK